MDDALAGTAHASRAWAEDQPALVAPLGSSLAGLPYWMLRLACAAEFIGHGAFGIMTKAAWVPYFGVVGIPPEFAWRLMPVVGTIDVTLGVLVLFVRPMRIVLLYMAVWGFLTATFRPLAGEPIWEFVERVPNWAVPLAFLYVRGVGRSCHAWLS